MYGLRALAFLAFVFVVVGCDSIPFFKNGDAEAPPAPAELPPPGLAATPIPPPTPLTPVAVQPVSPAQPSSTVSEVKTGEGEPPASQAAPSEKKVAKKSSTKKDSGGASASASASASVGAGKSKASVKTGVMTTGQAGLKKLGTRKIKMINLKKAEGGSGQK